LGKTRTSRHNGGAAAQASVLDRQPPQLRQGADERKVLRLLLLWRQADNGEAGEHGQPRQQLKERHSRLRRVGALDGQVSKAGPEARQGVPEPPDLLHAADAQAFSVRVAAAPRTPAHEAERFGACGQQQCQHGAHYIFRHLCLVSKRPQGRGLVASVTLAIGALEFLLLDHRGHGGQADIRFARAWMHCGICTTCAV
jgi:hypothetical protein